MWVAEYVEIATFMKKSGGVWLNLGEYETQEEALHEAEQFRKKSKFKVRTKVFLRHDRKDLD